MYIHVDHVCICIPPPTSCLLVQHQPQQQIDQKTSAGRTIARKLPMIHKHNHRLLYTDNYNCGSNCCLSISRVGQRGKTIGDTRTVDFKIFLDSRWHIKNPLRLIDYEDCCSCTQQAQQNGPAWRRAVLVILPQRLRTNAPVSITVLLLCRYTTPTLLLILTRIRRGHVIAEKFGVLLFLPNFPDIFSAHFFFFQIFSFFFFSK